MPADDTTRSTQGIATTELMTDADTVRIDLEEVLAHSKKIVGDDTVKINREDLELDTNIDVLSKLTQKPPDKYKFRKSIGRGGMKVVIQVKDCDTTRDIAMAVLPDASNRPKEEILRFIEEARITASLEHPNIVPVHDIGVDATGSPYFTMKLLKGETLASIIKKINEGNRDYIERYPLERQLRLFLKVCSAVAFAHSKGVIHLDLKPENVQVGDFGEVLLMDWGLAKVVESDRREADVADAIHQTSTAVRSPVTTLDGITKGTPGYMAPEQAAGLNSKRDFRTDIYSLGAILYTIITGKNPLTPGGSLKQKMIDTVNGDIIPPHLRSPDRDIPSALEAVVQKSMAVEPENRYSSVRELRDEVYKFIGGYATKAEKATMLKQAMLFVRRHKITVPTIALMLLLVGGILAYAVAESARQKGGWTQIYGKDFTAESVSLKGLSFCNAAVSMPMPEWSVVPGEGLKMNRGEWLWLSDVEATSSVRVDITVKASDQLDTLEISINSEQKLLKHSWMVPSGYTAQLPGYGLTTDRIFRNESSPVYSAEMMAALESQIKPGEENTITFEHSDDVISVTVNGNKSVLSANDLFPISGKDAGMIGLRSSSSNTILKSITVSQRALPEKASPIIAGDVLVENRHYQEAVSKYLELADSYVTGPIAEEALVKAYLTTVSYIDPTQDRRRMLFDIKHRIDERFADFRYRRKILEIDALVLWRENSFRSAMNIVTEVMTLDPNSDIVKKILLLPHTKLPDDIAFDLVEGIARSKDIKQLNISGYGISSLERLAGLKLVYLDCAYNNLTSLAGIEKMPLEVLICDGNRISSLTPLDGIPLKSFSCGRNELETFRPLNVSSLKTLMAPGNRIHNLLSLEGAKLEQINLRGNQLTSLAQLEGMPLKRIDAASNPIDSLTPLKGMDLETLIIDSTNVTDLRPLRDMPLITLSLFNCAGITDISPVYSMPTLEMLVLPPNVKDIEPLRNLPSLRYISEEGGGSFRLNSETAEDFWNRQDGGNGNGNGNGNGHNSGNNKNN